MKETTSREDGKHEPGSPSLWVLGIAALLLVVVSSFLPRRDMNLSGSSATNKAAASSATLVSPSGGHARSRRNSSSSDLGMTAEEIVARKLTQFGKNRRGVVHAIAKHLQVEVPSDVERFFEAVEGGNWEE